MIQEEKIPFHRPMILPEEDQESIHIKIDRCLKSGMLTNNQNVKELETKIKDYYNVNNVIATSSASQALVLSLQSILKSHQDIYTEYIHTQSFAWYSSKYAIETCNMIPVYSDIDTDTWTMKTPTIEQDIESRYISLPVHTFGNVSEVESHIKLYDGAHALGSKIKDFGDATVLSLAPTKIITSIEGGIILTDDNLLADTIRAKRDKISRMSEIHAIFGNTYFNHIDEVMKFKKEAFKYYKNNLDGIFQKTALSSNHNTIGMLTSLNIPQNIETKKYYEPLHDQTLTSVFSLDPNPLTNTEIIYNSIVCLPSYFNCPYKEIVEHINKYNLL